MFNSKAYALGANRSCIRELFEYGRSRAAVVGEENVLDFSLGNPSIPAPQAVEEAIREILRQTPSVEVHGYTPAGGDMAARDAIARELNRRYDWDVTPQELFLGCGAAVERTGLSGEYLPACELISDGQVLVSQSEMILTLLGYPQLPFYQGIKTIYATICVTPASGYATNGDYYSSLYSGSDK